MRSLTTHIGLEGDLRSTKEGEPEPHTGGPSPWGRIQTADRVADGIVIITTASHGGVWLSRERFEAMPKHLRSSDGWYEEDCEAVFALNEFRQELDAAIVHPDTLKESHEATVSHFGSFSEIRMNRPPFPGMAR